MKLDYKFIKDILITMEEYKEHQIYSYDLMKLLNIKNEENIINEQEIDKFVGHIKILGDNNFISCSAKDGKFGFVYGLGGNLMMTNTTYRLTAQGYEFLEILKNDTAFNKVKDFALNTALDIGKQIIVKLATGGM